jgi:glycogen debranching enzyme
MKQKIPETSASYFKLLAKTSILFLQTEYNWIVMITKCFEEAKKVLRGNASQYGVIAGREYYKDVWGRDGLVSSLGMAASDDEILIELAKKTIESIAKFQKSNGQLPNKFSPDGKKLCFGEGGCVDTSLWFPIALFNYYKNTGDKQFLNKLAPKALNAIEWAGCLDQNNDLLLETGEGSDWMDMLLRSGRVLYDQALYYKALLATDEILHAAGKERRFVELARNVKRNINIFFWPQEQNLEKVRQEFGHTGIEKDFELALENGEKNYYFAEVGFRKYDARCDVYANLLAVAFGIADVGKEKRIFGHIDSVNAADPYPVKVLDPPIGNEDYFRPFYFRQTDLPHLQLPGNYHNGGIWPYVGGFYVMALKKAGMDWRLALENLAAANKIGKLGDWEFNEWITASGQPLGSAHQSWSAAMYILAYQAAKGKKEINWILM